MRLLVTGPRKLVWYKSPKYPKRFSGKDKTFCNKETQMQHQCAEISITIYQMSESVNNGQNTGDHHSQGKRQQGHEAKQGSDAIREIISKINK